MRRRRPSYDQVNQEMRGKLPTFLVAQRGDNVDNPAKTWLEIAREIEDRTGLVIDRETVRRWHQAVTTEPAATMSGDAS